MHYKIGMNLHGNRVKETKMTVREEFKSFMALKASIEI